jgi:transcription antitermination factor NusG
METKWYLVNVLPGKERSLAEEFNKYISLGKMKSITRFVCPTEKNVVVVRNKKAIREKVLYSGFPYITISVVRVPTKNIMTYINTVVALTY